jgi:integrase
MPEYRVGRLKGKFVVTWIDAEGRRHRHRLDAKDARGAENEAPGIFATISKPRGSSVKELWNAYVADRQGRAVIATMTHTWKALADRFGLFPGDAITPEDCRAHTAARRNAGIKDGTIATELGHLRMVLRWAEKRRLIERASPIERPTPPKRKEFHLTREQCRQLIDNASMPHLRLYIILALGTGARNAALLELTWSRCDLERGIIDLRNPELNRPHKGRAIVPMNRTVRAALVEAQAGALSDHVIEWGGKPVRTGVEDALKRSAKLAGIAGSVSPHVLRHSAAVHMAEGEITMDEIAQYLGHENVEITRRVYARFSPAYLRKAAAELEYDDLGSMNQTRTTQKEEQKAVLLGNLVGAARIEPSRPTQQE